MTAPDLVWIEATDIMALHERLLVFYGGAAGLRDEGLLQSAIARPRQLLAYGEAVDVIDMATALTGGLVKNHPFLDGNKRIGFVAGILFIELNGYRFNAPEEAAAEAVMALAAGGMDEAGYAAFLREHVTVAPG
jgi:death-on-curing protein